MSIRDDDLRVLFVLKWRGAAYGYSSDSAWGEPGALGKPLESGICNSAKMAEHMLRRMGVTTKLVHVTDANGIHKEIVEFGATVVIVEAYWVTPAKFDELAKAVPAVSFIVRNHSETPFFANEGIGFDWSLRYLRQQNVRVAPNAPRMLAEMRFLAAQILPGVGTQEIDAKVPYLPNYYVLREEYVRPSPAKEWIDVGCFGAIRPMKNPVTQAIAAMMFAREIGKPLRFHVNGARIEMGGDPVYKNLVCLFEQIPDAELVEHAWRSHEDFLALMLEMDLVAQVSFSETFNIVAADALSEGVALVTSDEVPWSAKSMQADPTDSADIARVMLRAWRIKQHSPELSPGLEAIRAYNERSREAWSGCLGLPVRAHARPV